jgi:hypothetical protein
MDLRHVSRVSELADGCVEACARQRPAPATNNKAIAANEKYLWFNIEIPLAGTVIVYRSCFSSNGLRPSRRCKQPTEIVNEKKQTFHRAIGDW